MPHYKDGTAAQIGDLVKGVGYNVKDADGKPAVIVGTLIDLRPGPSCNVSVAHTTQRKLPDDFRYPDHRVFQTKGVIHQCPCTEHKSGAYVHVDVNVEYGQADQFELVHRPEAAPVA